jgi:catechol 2,3-dioxygenase-like lactoylglutathione lyase family enzyme
MLHHISLPVSDLVVSLRLYDSALEALGYRRVSSGVDFAGYGLEDGKDKFLIAVNEHENSVGKGFHLALAAPSRKAVDNFHKIALQFGALNNGNPGLREQYGPTYYAAFIIDPDGHHIEAVINDQGAD